MSSEDSDGKHDSAKMEDVPEKPSFEKVLEELGMLGKYQLIQLTMTFLSKLIITFMAMTFVFVGYAPPHVCSKVNETLLLIDHDIDPFNLSTNVEVLYENKCEVTIVRVNESESAGYGDHEELATSHCLNGRNFYTTDGQPTTYISDWDLVCESTGIAEWSQTILIVGQIIGGIIMSQIVDSFGRKPVFVFCTISVFILEGAVLVVPSIYFIYAIKFFSGVCVQGVITSYIVFGMELLMPRHRQIYGVAICILWLVQLLVIGGIAYIMRNENWRYFQCCVVVCGVFCFLYPFFMTESPRWLVANGKIEEARAIIKLACKQNKKDFNDVKKIFDEFVSATLESSESPIPLMPVSVEKGDGRAERETIDTPPEVEVKNTHGVKKYNFMTLLQTRHLFFMTLISLYVWVTCNMTYYGLYMTSSSLAGDRFLNYILMALVEIPSNAVILPMLNKLSRRVVLITFMAMSAISLMTSSMFVTLVDGYEYVSTILFVLGKFAITCAFNVIFIYTPEIFPTNLRGVGTGFCSSFGRIGSMVAPFLRPLYLKAPWAPGLMFTIMCAISCFLIPFLPETKDKNLPTDVEDIKKDVKLKRKP